MFTGTHANGESLAQIRALCENDSELKQWCFAALWGVERAYDSAPTLQLGRSPRCATSSSRTTSATRATRRGPGTGAPR